jgi:hypothetical protein
MGLLQASAATVTGRSLSLIDRLGNKRFRSRFPRPIRIGLCQSHFPFAGRNRVTVTAKASVSLLLALAARGNRAPKSMAEHTNQIGAAEFFNFRSHRRDLDQSRSLAHHKSGVEVWHVLTSSARLDLHSRKLSKTPKPKTKTRREISLRDSDCFRFALLLARSFAGIEIHAR